MTLSEAANWAQIVSIPLTVALWLLTRDRLAKLWAKYFWWIVGIVLILTTWGLYRFGWLDWVTADVTWPVWALILLTLSVPVVLSVIAGFVLMTNRNKDSEPNPESYTSDLIDGIQWRWGYVGHLIDTESLAAFCPDPACKSRLQLVIDNFTGVVLRCPHCGFARQFNPDSKGLRRRIGIEIERRINTGEFKRRIAEPGATQGV